MGVFGHDRVHTSQHLFCRAPALWGRYADRAPLPCERVMHAWLAVDGRRLVRADQVVEIKDGPRVAVRVHASPTRLYPIGQAAAGSGQELAAVLAQAEEIAHQYGKPQVVSAGKPDQEQARWVIHKLVIDRSAVAVWPADVDASSPGPFPFFALGVSSLSELPDRAVD